MENNRDQMDEKNNETITSTEENTQEHSQSTGRLNIEDINRRNAEERRKEKKSSYIITGIVAGLLIIVAIFFFN